MNFCVKEWGLRATANPKLSPLAGKVAWRSHDKREITQSRQVPRGVPPQTIRLIWAQVGTRSPYSHSFVILPVPARSSFRFIRHRRRSTPNPASRWRLLVRNAQSLNTQQKSTCISRCFSLVHPQGLEPWTPWLRVRCSTNWAKSAYPSSEVITSATLLILPQKSLFVNNFFKVFLFFSNFFQSFLFPVGTAPFSDRSPSSIIAFIIC